MEKEKVNYYKMSSDKYKKLYNESEQKRIKEFKKNEKIFLELRNELRKEREKTNRDALKYLLEDVKRTRESEVENDAKWIKITLISLLFGSIFNLIVNYISSFF